MKQLIKGVYRALPLKKQAFSVIRKFYTPPESIFQHLPFTGVFTVDIDREHSFKIKHYGYYVENSLFWEGFGGGWEKASVKLWAALAKNSEVVFDIGANTGVYSLIAKSINRGVEVHAFEPIARVFEKLESNNKLNGFDIKCYDLALSDANGEATVYDRATEHTYSVTVNKNTFAGTDVETIPTQIKIARLDTFIESNNIQKIDLMKIDVETHEPEVLAGFGEYLARFKPALLIELWEGEIVSQIKQILNDIDYVYFNINEETGEVRQIEQISKSDSYNLLICTREAAKRINLHVI